MMFLVEEEVRAHDSGCGFRLSGFRLHIQGHGLGFNSVWFLIFFHGGDWYLSATQNLPELQRNPHIIISELQRKG